MSTGDETTKAGAEWRLVRNKDFPEHGVDVLIGYWHPQFKRTCYVIGFYSCVQKMWFNTQYTHCIEIVVCWMPLLPIPEVYFQEIGRVSNPHVKESRNENEVRDDEQRADHIPGDHFT